MPAAGEELRRSYPARPEMAAIARKEIGELAERHGATGEQVDEVRLLTCEAVTNAIRHAYPDEPGLVEVVAAVSDGLLTILISDDGIGPRKASRSPGAGWGWPVMAALSERLAIRRRGSGGTEVEMRVHFGPDRGR
jgi:anti-sigma regulatory factor (Ser/Thr protein kinase)